MAAPRLREVRRRKGGALTASAAPSRALVAASSPVEDPNDVFKTGMSGTLRCDWQKEAWSFYDLVGEFGFYVRFRARSCSRVRLVASEIDPDTGEPTGSIAEDNAEGQWFAELVRAIADGPLGQAQLIKRAVEILTVAGELWIAVLVRDEGVQFFAVTKEEIERGTRRDKVNIVLPDGTKHEFDKDNGDGMFRVWNPHPKRANDPDSPVRSCLDSLREIVRTTRKIRNADNSRLNNNGFLFIPSEASLPDSQAPVSANKPDADPDAPTSEPRVSTSRKFQDAIIQAAQEGAKDENSAAALVPVVGAAPGEHLKEIKHVTFGKDITNTALETREKAIDRLAMGLDMAPEQLRGLGSQANHWSAHQIGDEDVQLHVSPAMEVLCQGIYTNVLRHLLVAEGIDPAKYVLWYDTSRLTADPDLSDEAKALLDAGAITIEAAVRLSGLPDDALYDLTTPDGVKVWVLDAVQKDPTLLPMLAVELGKLGIEIDAAAPRQAIEGGNPDDGDPQEEPDTENDEPVAAAVQVRGGAELAVVDLFVSRALAMAGRRRVKTNDLAQRARLADVAARDYYRYMPAVAASEIPRLIKGWDEDLTAEYAAAYGFDAEWVRGEVLRIVRRELTSPVIDGQVI